jgi:alpha-pyrone synthase
MSYITAIGIANPEARIAQPAIADFMVQSMQLNDYDARKLKAIFKASGIDNRYSVLEDYGRLSDFTFYSDNLKHKLPGTKARGDLYQKYAPPLSAKAAYAALEKISLNAEDITHLITVSCTGMYAPGLDIDLIKLLKLKSDVQRTCINFMGCYAAFNGLRVADSFCKANPKAKVLIVCTELCSIHFQNENTEDNLLANALFADGSAAIVVEGALRPGINFNLTKFYSDLAFEGEHDMAWRIGDTGFEMSLSSYVPRVVNSGMLQLTDKLLEGSGYSLQEIDFFAPHPGGLKILSAIENALGITRQHHPQAYQVLQQYGNMSSPTVVFVLHELMRSLSQVDEKKTVMSFAFGPGLTLESMLLEICSG